METQLRATAFFYQSKGQHSLARFYLNLIYSYKLAKGFTNG